MLRPIAILIACLIPSLSAWGQVIDPNNADETTQTPLGARTGDGFVLRNTELFGGLVLGGTNAGYSGMRAGAEVGGRFRTKMGVDFQIVFSGMHAPKVETRDGQLFRGEAIASVRIWRDLGVGPSFVLIHQFTSRWEKRAWHPGVVARYNRGRLQFDFYFYSGTGDRLNGVRSYEAETQWSWTRRISVRERTSIFSFYPTGLPYLPRLHAMVIEFGPRFRF